LPYFYSIHTPPSTFNDPALSSSTDGSTPYFASLTHQFYFTEWHFYHHMLFFSAYTFPTSPPYLQITSIDLISVSSPTDPSYLSLT